MKNHQRLTQTVLITAFLLLCFAYTAQANESNWPQFRGPGGLGIAPDDQSYPAALDQSQNLLWKTELPKGHSSPCIWGDQIFVTATSGKSLETICIDRRNGKIKWRRSVVPEKLERISSINSHAAPTPVCDGKKVYVYFGSFGLIAYSLEGDEVWNVPLPVPSTRHGSAASPILANNMILINCDQMEGAYLLAVNRDTGETIWRQDRLISSEGWSTPVLWKHGHEEELVVLGSQQLISYDLEDGRERWRLSHLPYGAAPTPVYAGDTLFVTAVAGRTGDPVNVIDLPDFKDLIEMHDSDQDGRLAEAEIPEDLVSEYRYGPILAGVKRNLSRRYDTDQDGAISEAEWNKVVVDARKIQPSNIDALVAIRSGGQGEISQTHLKWMGYEGIGQVPSPLVYQDRVYLLKHGGNVTCYDAKTGRRIYGDKLGPKTYYYASPVAADGKIYFCSVNGDVIVVQAGDQFKVLAQNKIGERIYATPAPVGGQIYLRTDKNMYAFVNDEDDINRTSLAKREVEEGVIAKTVEAQARDLHAAATGGDLALAQSLVSSGEDVNARNHWGWTPLYTAAAVSQGSIIEFLVAKGANVDTPSELGMTPLCFAVSNGNTDIAVLLIKSGADCRMADSRGVTPLHYASRNSSKDTAAFLIRNGADVNASDKYGRTSLGHALEGGDPEFIELLLVNGADVNVRNKWGGTYLDRVARDGKTEIVKILLAKGADFQSQNNIGRTAMGLAKENGHESTFELIREHAIQAGCANEIMSPFDYAAIGDMQKIKTLISTGMDVNSKNPNGSTLLHAVSAKGHKDIAEHLIGKGAKVNTTNGKGRTPLVQATLGGHFEIVELFLTKGADLTTTYDDKGLTVLGVARQSGKTEIAELLVKHGAKE